MKQIVFLTALILLFFPPTQVSGIDERPQDPKHSNLGEIKEISLEIDGVSLTLTTPFFPDQFIIIPDPDDPNQVVNIVQRDPIYKSLTITAIPYGFGNSAEIFTVVESNRVDTYREALIDYRRSQGGSPQSGPNAAFFGQELTGITSTVFVNLDVFNQKPVQIAEWVFEEGKRLWIMRISQEVQVVEHLSDELFSKYPGLDELLVGISLVSDNVGVPSTSSAARDLRALETPSEAIPSDSDLPFPHWWDGECDENTYHSQTGEWSYPLGGEYRGVKACGPRPYYDDADHAIVNFNPGWWGVLEWECVELSMRFLYLAYGVQTYQANGNQVVTNYSGDKLIKINDGTPGFAPQPNDVLSLGPETPVGHTSVVIASNVDYQGNGIISVLEENSSSNGLRNYSVIDWHVQSSYIVIGWLHDPDNADTTPPTGDILNPEGQEIIQENTVHLEGWASDDDSGMASAQFIANYDDAWYDVGPSFNTLLFNYAWDWCSAEVPEGPVNLALRLIDNQGNQTPGFPGLRGVVKEYDCPPPPTCTPNADQVALFEEINYGGDCQILDTGIYLDPISFSSVGDNNTESILTGSNVMATIYTASNQQGRRETIARDDPNLSDNPTKENTLSSIIITSRNTIPEVPSGLWPINLDNLLDNQSITLFWQNEGNSTKTRTTIDGPSLSDTTAWDNVSTWNLGSLAPGVYSWKIQSRNDFSDSSWSDWYYFIVSDAGSTLPAGVTTPYLDDLEGDTSDWRTTGLWHLFSGDSSSTSHSWYYGLDASGTYDTGGSNFGVLTTPPITLTVNSEPYFLTFWSKHQTENPFPHWDQRRVQISVDGADFMDIYQLKEGPFNHWLENSINLAPYYTPDTGHSLQVRFYFSTIDEIDNAHLGWLIDDIQVQAQAPVTCTDPNEDNDTPWQATALAYGDSGSASICPGGDPDFYTFTGAAGDQIVIDIDASTIGSPLDPIIYLLDIDGSSILAQHDDEILGVRRDPHLGYRLTRDGVYFLKIQAWDNPMGTGDYTFSFFTDQTAPTINSIFPPTGTYLPPGVIVISVNASDNLSGISHVQFLGYADGWSEINQDWDGSDGWSTAFDTTALQEGDVIAFYARVYDWAGNISGIAAWDITLDFSHPDTTAPSLPDPNPTTAIYLTWESTDNLAGIRSYHIRHKVNSEDWITESFDVGTESWWFVGEAGNAYAFRIRAIDDAGNIEPYLEGAEVDTTIPVISSLCSAPDPWDSSSTINDNSISNPTTLPGTWQTHNFCNPEVPDRLNDVDWFQLSMAGGESYTITTTPQHTSTGVVISLYASDGITLLAETSPDEFGQPSSLVWNPLQDEDVYIRLSHLDGNVAGEHVAYQVAYQTTESPTVYIPLIQR